MSRGHGRSATFCAVLACWLAAPLAANPPSDAKPIPPSPAISVTNVKELVQGPIRNRVLDIIAKPTLHVTGPAELFPVEPALWDWLLDHPLWVAGLWRQIGMPIAPVEKTASGFRCTEDELTTADFQVVGRGKDRRVIYAVCETRRPPLPGRFRFEVVLVHTCQPRQLADGRTVVRQQAEAFVAARGAAAAAVLRLAKPACDRAVEQSLQEMQMFFSLMIRIVQLRPKWSQAAVAKLRREGVLPKAEGAELAALIVALPPPRRPPASDAKMPRVVVPATSNREVTPPLGVAIGR